MHLLQKKHVEILACVLATICLLLSSWRCLTLFANTEALAKSADAAVAMTIGADMRLYTNAVRKYHATGELYERPANASVSIASMYAPMTPKTRNTPVFHAQLIPIAKSQHQEAIITSIRTVMIAAYFLACLGLTIRTGKIFCRAGNPGTRAFLFYTLAAIAATSSYGLQDAIRITNYEIVIFSLLTASFLFLEKHPHISATAIGFLASAKFYPAFMASILLTKPDKKVIATLIFSVLVFFILGFIFFGHKENIFYWQYIFPALLSEKVSPILYNMSFGGAIFRFSQDIDITQVAFQAYRLLLLGLTCILLVKKRRDLARRSAEIFALLMALMLICLPNYWQTYLIMLFPAFCVAIYRVVIQPGATAIVALLVCMASMAIDNHSWLEIGAPAWINSSAALDETGSRIMEIARNQGENLALLAFAYHYPWTAALYLLEQIKFIVPAILWFFCAREILSPALPCNARPGSADLVKS